MEPYLERSRAERSDYTHQLALAAILFERETYYLTLYGPYGAYGSTPLEEHGDAWQPFPATPTGQEALRLRRDPTLNAGSPPPFDLFGLKTESLDALEATLDAAPSHLTGVLLASRFAADLEQHLRALELAERALRVSPKHRAALAATHSTLSILADGNSAYRSRARALEKRVRSTFGTNWMHEAGSALDKQALDVRRLAWQLRTATEGERFTRFLKTEAQFCEESRAQALTGFDNSRVPDGLRELIPWARRFGVGDDPCRAHFIRRATTHDRKAAIRLVTPGLHAIHAWVSVFEPGTLSPEAAAFYWLLEAIEEMRSA